MFKEACVKLGNMGVTVHFNNKGYSLNRNGKEIHLKSQDEVIMYSNRLHNLHLEHHIDNLPFHASVIHYGKN